MKNLINIWNNFPLETKIGIIVFAPIVVLAILFVWMMQTIFRIVDSIC